ncbi:MAG TPA: type II toxin-antitoxin system CcdA family antitoxin [Nevskia sp.]|nr:type II toxin-antitoxin system CcdA family antitoxin [Nevskia sp.]
MALKSHANKAAAKPEPERLSLLEQIQRRDQLSDAEREARKRAWQEENREAIEAYNAYIDKYGCFGDEDKRGF